MIKKLFKTVIEALAIEPAYVKINNDIVERLAEEMKKDGRSDFFDNKKEYNTGIYVEILKELVASSINYCYWYGAHNLRPNDVSSTAMYECVEYAFKDAKTHALNFEKRIYHLIELLSVNRFPMLEERKKHLLELCEGRKAEIFAEAVMERKADLDMICRYFQGFAADIFLKRASLFFIQVYRKYGWFNDMELPVPADYQVPKILRYFNCITYTPALEEDIYENKLIHKGSIQEIQIRAATIEVCERLKNKLGWHIGDVDTYLWTRRKEVDMPFHCTYTTDY